MITSFEQLKRRAGNMQQEKAYQVGPAYSGHQRAVYTIGLVQVLVDTIFSHNPFKPSEEWYWTGDNMATADAEAMASKYGARAVDAYYSDNDEKMLFFNSMNGLLLWIWDNRRHEINAN